MKTTMTYQTQYQPKGGKPQGKTGYVVLTSMTTL